MGPLARVSRVLAIWLTVGLALELARAAWLGAGVGGLAFGLARIAFVLGMVVLAVRVLEGSPPSVASGPVRVRLATAAEMEDVAALMNRAFLEFEPLYTPAAFAATTPPADALRARLDEGPTWIALLADRPVGTVSALAEGDALYVRSMAVDPGARGRGVGRALLEEVERHAIDGGFVRLTLSTTPFLAAAIRLYEATGFVRTGEGDLFGTPLFDMEKRLAVVHP